MKHDKIIFVNPRPSDESFVSDLYAIPPLALEYLIALTPKEKWEIEFIDEYPQNKIGKKDSVLNECGIPNFEADIVALTSFTYAAPRAYEIAESYRKKGVPVVIGGVHATLVPEEASKYADTVVIGESLNLWQQILKDFESGTLKKEYEGNAGSLDNLLHPNKKFVEGKYNYPSSPLATSMGCPNKCDFCCVPVSKKGYRERPVTDVLREMESTEQKNLILTDDNFYGYNENSHTRAKNLFKGMIEIGLQKNWWGATTLDILKDDKTLSYMNKSGCLGILIGIESLDKKVLESMNKEPVLRTCEGNVIEFYKSAIKKLHDNGINVDGPIILGNDNETFDLFKKIVEFYHESGIDTLTPRIKTPFPRTSAYNKLLSEERIFRNKYPKDWHYYNYRHLTFKLNNMKLEKFIEGMEYLYKEIFNNSVLFTRYKRSLNETNNKLGSASAYHFNNEWKKLIGLTIKNLKELYDSGHYPK